MISGLFFKIAPQNITCELFPNIFVKLNLKDLTMKATFWLGDRFEFPTTAVLKTWRSEGGAFFDIGANYGFYSLYMLHQQIDILVYAFEPNPITFKHLKSTKINNRLDRLHIFNCGLGSKDEHLKLHPGIDDSGHSTFLNDQELAHRSLGEIPITTFDNWVRDQEISYPDHPEWIAKIDVEGMELSVLKGMKMALTKKAFRGICIEVFEPTLARNGHKPEEIYYFMKTVGYQHINSRTLIQRYGRINTDNIFFEPITS
ncbi:MAG: FkbM family methyltransferase [Thermodesulfobacteriota bacterium]|jgi:FkbM family methyltransferase